MTDRYTAYLTLLAARDSVVTALAVLALAVVAGWELARRLPPAWYARLRPIYLIGGMLLYLMTIIVIATMEVTP